MTKRKIKLKFWKMVRWIDRKIQKKIDLTESQEMGMKIFERTVSIKDAEIFLSPLSDSIYIEVNDVYIILEAAIFRLSTVNSDMIYTIQMLLGLKCGLRF